MEKPTLRLSDNEWAFLYAMCKRQSLVGIGFAGISRLPSEQRPPLKQLAQWIHDSEKLKHNFRLIRHYPEEVIWEPFFRIYHFIWRKLELWRY